VRRDLELLREILLTVEQAEGPFDLTDARLSGRSFPELAQHAELLIEAGLIKGEIVSSDSSGVPVYVRILRLTWAGHEFLAMARDEQAWRQALDSSPQGPAAVSFEVLCQVLTELARTRMRPM
jgi:hypothetical protein